MVVTDIEHIIGVLLELNDSIPYC